MNEELRAIAKRLYDLASTDEAAPVPDVVFFGCMRGQSGHFWSDSTFERREPFGIDGVFAPRKAGGREEAPQGVCRVVLVRGHTVVAWWDRSQDTRGGCNSALVARGVHSFASMVAAGKVKFPWAFERMKFALVEE